MPLRLPVVPDYLVLCLSEHHSPNHLLLSLGIPIIDVDHMEAHILAHFIEEPGRSSETPAFPFLCLTVSGGHSQIVLVRDYFDFTIVGKTIDDAAGEAFDKAAKILGLPYPGGPLIDKLAKDGDENAFSFPEPAIPGLDYSFSGLKTSFLYFIRDRLKEDPHFHRKKQSRPGSFNSESYCRYTNEKAGQSRCRIPCQRYCYCRRCLG